MNKSIPDAARALFAALPTCEKCGAPATAIEETDEGVRLFCDEERRDDDTPAPWAAPAADLRAALDAEAADALLVAAVVEAAEAWRDANFGSQEEQTAIFDTMHAVDALRAKRGQK